MATAREKFKFQNTLLCLLKGLIGRKVVVELRNEHSVVGTIEDVDWLMNTSMTHARYTTPDGRIMAFEQFYIQGRNIRFVQIPNYVDIMETINTELRKFQVSILSKSVGLFHILGSKLGPAPGPPGGVLPMWWVIHMCRGFDPLFSLWQDRARSFWGIFLIHQQQSYLLGYKNYQFLQKSIFLAPNSIFSSIFLGPIFSGQRHTPISFQAEYPPRAGAPAELRD